MTTASEMVAQRVETSEYLAELSVVLAERRVDRSWLDRATGQLEYGLEGRCGRCGDST